MIFNSKIKGLNSLTLLLFCILAFSCISNSKKAADLANKKNSIINNNSVENLKSDELIIDTNAIALVSWNIQDLGQSKNNDEIEFIVNLLKDFDVIAIQEVVGKHPAGAQKIAQIADELNRKGFKWDYRISNPTNSPSSQMSERYAFIWKTSRLELLGKPYLDSELAKEIIREPFISKFRDLSSGATLNLVNFHSRKHYDKPELEIVYFKDYQRRLDNEALIIAGDFNLDEKHEVWTNLYNQGYKSAIKNSKTTLKRKCDNGEYLSHEIDNIYYSKVITSNNSGVIDYIQSCKNLNAARLISDHLPVFLEFTLTNE